MASPFFRYRLLGFGLTRPLTYYYFIPSVSECEGFSLKSNSTYNRSFGDELFQAIDCTGTDSETITQTTTKRKLTKHRITNLTKFTDPNKTQNTHMKPISKTVHL